MTALAAFRLGPHHGPTFEPFGVLSYDRDQHRHVLAEFTDRATAQAARDRIRHDMDAFALLLCESAGEWAPAGPAPDARAALIDYAREWNRGLLDNRQGEVKALLAALRSDRSPMWRWGTFELLAASIALADTELRDSLLGRLLGGGQ